MCTNLQLCILNTSLIQTFQLLQCHFSIWNYISNFCNASSWFESLFKLFMLAMPLSLKKKKKKKKKKKTPPKRGSRKTPGGGGEELITEENSKLGIDINSKCSSYKVWILIVHRFYVNPTKYDFPNSAWLFSVFFSQKNIRIDFYHQCFIRC